MPGKTCIGLIRPPWNCSRSFSSKCRRHGCWPCSPIVQSLSPPWGSHSYLSQLTLSRLGQSHVEVMVEKVTGGKALPREIVRQIASKTDGVPLFVEELTKMVVESGLVTEVNGRYELTGPLPPLAIPSTLQDSLMARLDRLATVREIAQIGATIGREFNYELLQAVSPLNEDSIATGAAAVSRSRARVSEWRATAGAVSLQTCAGAGHGLSVACSRAAASSCISRWRRC